MKSAIYIEDGVVQLVLTPQNDFEKNALGSFEDKDLSLEIHRGAFYYCQGGWHRQGGDAEERSLILRAEENGD